MFFVGGALLNDFLKDEGCEIGKSLIDENNYGISEFIKTKN